MTKTPPDPEETVQVGGQIYGLNDHVYLSAPWNAPDGAPWLIGRIMEFIKDTAPSAPAKKKKSRPIVQIKLAHYHRQRDLLSRHIIDCRLLEASMTYDIFCISRLRGKCRVEFKGDRSQEEIEAWKATPDCFYFSQVYGRYTHRHYDLILTQNIKNAPPEVIQFLRSNYSYIFTEPGMGPELSEERRGCISCRRWTSGADSVSCALCNGAYHFSCLNPPLIRKPERGYRWACAPCSKQRQDSLEDATSLTAKLTIEQSGSSTTSVTTPGGGRSLRDKGKKREMPVMNLVQTGTGPNGVFRTVDGWPFRYYGQYTEPISVLDPMDSPYLYTAPRIGCRFQSNVPDEVDSEHDWNAPSLHRSVGRPMKVDRRTRDPTPMPSAAILAEIELPRGGDETIDIISTPDQFANLDDSVLDDYISHVKQLPLFKLVGVTLIDKALAALREPASDSMAVNLEKLRGLTAKALGCMTWSESESNRMDSAIAQLGEDMRGMLKLFPKKSWSDVTRFFYTFKGHKFPESSALETRWNASVSQPPDENLFILPTPSSKRPYACVVCEARMSPTWRRCPAALVAGAFHAKKCICNDCHLRWRKYGLQHVPVAHQDDNRARDKRTRPYNKHPKTLGPRPAPPTPTRASPLHSPPASVAEPPVPPDTCPSEPSETSETSVPLPPATASPPTPPAPPVVPPPPPPTIPITKPPPPCILAPPPPVIPVVSWPCVLCNRLEPQGRLVRCSNCSLTCHTICVGLDSVVDPESWRCLVCRNIDSKSVSKILCCSLCQAQPHFPSPDQPLNALDVWKLSEYNSFVHMLCALWHVELAMNASVDMTRVEGFASIPLSKRKRDCALCHKSGVGACTKCDQCSTHVHVSCAWSAGYLFGFEMLPQKKRRPRESDLVTFNGKTGLLETRIWCQSHQPDPERMTLRLSDIDPNTQMTALQTYISHQKDVGANPSLEILRKARRFDGVFESVTKPKYPVHTMFGSKAWDLEDGYMVAALGPLPPTSDIATDRTTHSGEPTRVNRQTTKVSEGSPEKDASGLRSSARGQSKGRYSKGRRGGATKSRSTIPNVGVQKSYGSEESSCPTFDIKDDSKPVKVVNDTDQNPPDPAACLQPTSGKGLVHIGGLMASLNKLGLPEPTGDPEHNSEQARVQPVSLPVHSSSDLSDSKTSAGCEVKGPVQNTKPSTKRAFKNSSNANTGSEAPPPKRHASKSGRSALQKSVCVSQNVEGSVKGSTLASTETAPKTTPDETRAGLPAPARVPNKLRLTIKPALALPPPPSLPLNKVDADPLAPRINPARPSLPLPPPFLNVPESDMLCQPFMNKPLRPAPPPPPPSLYENEGRHLDRPTLPTPSSPKFACVPPSNLSHHALSHPSRPMSSSSSSSSTLSSKPVVTRLPSINQLDAFNPLLSRLHPPPTHGSAPLATSTVYLPPISTVAPRGRSPPIGLLSTPISPICVSPAPGLPLRSTSHFRFAAPFSNPPSFDAFARGAAATSSMVNNIHPAHTPSNHVHRSTSPVLTHPKANHSTPPPRKNILT